MESTYPVFELCLKLRELGFPQLRKYQAMYYVMPDTLICIDDLSCLKHDGLTDFEDIFGRLIFKPRMEDLLDACSDYLREFVRMGDGTIMAYSVIEEDPAYIAETGRTDPFIRANGATHWEALVNLCIALKSKERRSTLTPEDVAASENQQEGVIDPNLP